METKSHTVTIAAEQDLERWQQSALERQPQNPMLDAGWYRVLADAFSVERLFLVCRNSAGQVAGLAPLYCSRSPFTGTHITNLEDGWYAEDSMASHALLDAARSLCKERNARYLLLRHAEAIAGAADRVVPTVRRIIDTSKPAAAILSDVKKKSRWAIRQAASKGFVIKEDPGLECMEIFYTLYARHMRDLGTPVMSMRYMLALKRHFGAARLKLFFVCRDGREIGGMLCISAMNTWLNMYAVTRKDFMAEYPNYLLYWRAIERAAGAGIARFDLGRSRPASNTFLFKAKWPGIDHEVPHCYFGGAGKLNRIHEQESLMQRIWKHVPLPVANWAGPKIRNQLPFS
jgi:hypothetical protein